MLKISCRGYLNHQHSMTAYFYFSKCSPKRSWCVETLAFYPEHPKWYENLQFTPLKEMTNIPNPFTMESYPRGSISLANWKPTLSSNTLSLFQLLVSFPTPSEVQCVLKPWLKHVGFCLIYGSLALKTWRWSFPFHTHDLEVACHLLNESHISRSLVLEYDHLNEIYRAVLHVLCLLWCTKWLYLLGIWMKS